MNHFGISIQSYQLLRQTLKEVPEIEKVIMELSWVREVAVLGVKDTQWGEAGHAYVVAKDPTLYNLEALSNHCSVNLAKFKIPKQFTQLNDLPKGDSGKILKRLINQ